MIRSAADIDTISRRLSEIRAQEDFYRSRQCAMRSGGKFTVASCWCQGMGVNGVALPCPPVEPN